MTHGQYLSMCMIGAVAVIAFLETRRIASALRTIGMPGSVLQPGNAIV